ncbi:hypothetical protein V499_01307 [Pseudogymnoascus sp. VKM F-103]|nr:hypothetical protein V499_01307 [Pseudogymnoascus sp. VKM F-103]
MAQILLTAEYDSRGTNTNTILILRRTPLAEIHAASNRDVDAAISSASEAFKTWSTTPAIVRTRILLKAVQILRERNDEIAKVETQDTGKPFSETITVDVVTGADVVEYFANLVGGSGLNGETAQLREDARVYTKKEALSRNLPQGSSTSKRTFCDNDIMCDGMIKAFNSAIRSLGEEEQANAFSFLKPMPIRCASESTT